eukprot:TRINITY_DN28562_c0_g1_i1.p1 TRINITY_DN28562_c0_g1~~TRINITY_DN28562_c0_g1_i1.p1  ORF type:complete len:326 (-),score=50.87 TRINITY_DN28562_c0_g1_i1:52-975(-)
MASSSSSSALAPLEERAEEEGQAPAHAQMPARVEESPGSQGCGTCMANPWQCWTLLWQSRAAAVALGNAPRPSPPPAGGAAPGKRAREAQLRAPAYSDALSPFSWQRSEEEFRLHVQRVLGPPSRSASSSSASSSSAGARLQSQRLPAKQAKAKRSVQKVSFCESIAELEELAPSAGGPLPERGVRREGPGFRPGAVATGGVTGGSSGSGGGGGGGRRARRKPTREDLARANLARLMANHHQVRTRFLTCFSFFWEAGDPQGVPTSSSSSQSRKGVSGASSSKSCSRVDDDAFLPTAEALWGSDRHR